jgi:hypothetical protein
MQHRERIMATAVQIIYNGNGSDIVVRDVPAALTRVADNLYGTGGDLEALVAKIKADKEDFAFLEGEGLYPSLAHRLGRLAKAEGREMIELLVHEIDAPLDRRTSVLHYDLVDPSDPVAKLVDAVIAVAHDDADVDETADELYSACVAAISHVSGFHRDPEKTLALLRTYQETFGYPVGHRLAVIPSEAEVAGNHAKVLDDLPRRIALSFREMGPSLVAPPESPSP